MTGTGLAPTLTTLAVNTAPRRSSCPFVSGSATGASVDCRVKQGQMVPHSEQVRAAHPPTYDAHRPTQVPSGFRTLLRTQTRCVPSTHQRRARHEEAPKRQLPHKPEQTGWFRARSMPEPALDFDAASRCTSRSAREDRHTGAPDAQSPDRVIRSVGVGYVAVEKREGLGLPLRASRPPLEAGPGVSRGMASLRDARNGATSWTSSHSLNRRESATPSSGATFRPDSAMCLRSRLSRRMP